MTTDTRQRLMQFPVSAMEETLWRDFEPSDPVNHRHCGFIPTGTQCYACKKPLGKPLKDPFIYQRDIFEDDHLTILIAGGEQVGKSYTGAMKALMIILGFLGQYAATGRAANEVAWLVGANYEQTAREFEYLKQWLGQVQTTDWKIDFEASNRVDPGEIAIRVSGGMFKIKTKSADDARTSLRMESPVLALVCEAALITYDAYIRLVSRVARARADFPGYGGIILISTFEGSVGWYPTLYSKLRIPERQYRENGIAFSMPSHSNIFVYKGGRKDEQILDMEAKLSEDEFNERFLAIPAPPRGRVFNMFDPTIHILRENAEYDPDKRVLIGIDPGYSGQPSTYSVEVVQERDLPCGEKHFQGIDEIFETELTNEQITNIAKNRFWWPNPDKYGVVDVAAGSHAGAQIPAKEVWRKLTGLNLRSQRVNILPGIQRMKSMFSLCANPSCGEPVFVLSPCQEGAAAEFGGLPFPKDHPLEGISRPYRWKTDRSGEVVDRVPEDRSNDTVKALTYLFIDLLGHTLTSVARKKIRVKKTGFRGMSQLERIIANAS